MVWSCDVGLLLLGRVLPLGARPGYVQMGFGSLDKQVIAACWVAGLQGTNGRSPGWRSGQVVKILRPQHSKTIWLVYRRKGANVHKLEVSVTIFSEHNKSTKMSWKGGRKQSGWF